MATLALQVAGQVVGTALGGPLGGILGRVAGAVAGAGLDSALLGGGANGKSVEGPRLKSLDGISSTEGAPVPRVYGRARLGGQVIWATRFEEVVTTRKTGSEGGKGLGGASTAASTTETTYAYFANVAVALCEGPIAFVRRVWADGELLDLTAVTMRVYRGDEIQLPDPLIVAKDGAALSCAYRGAAYVVFERLPLEQWGNRLPQLSFEVVAPPSGVRNLVQAVSLIPGSGEFAYETLPVSRTLGLGESASENRHQLERSSDWFASLEQLQALCPSLGSVELVVAWFGDDLRVGQCSIAPRVESADKATSGAGWLVGGIDRSAARIVSQVDGRGAYGGTPSDAAVMRAIVDLRRRGLKVVFYPFVMMDVPAGNGRTDPVTGAADQPPYPWRGRVTCAPVPGVAGSPDGTAAVAAQVAGFFGAAQPAHFSAAGETVMYSGPDEWSFRRQVLHYATLCAAAGGVDAFLLGSEWVGLTRLRSAPGTYPAVARFRQLAADVRAILGPGVKIGYGADWTEYGAHVLDGGAEVRFPLDPLWGDANIDFVGVDWYPPIADWRDGDGHLDKVAGADSALDPSYLLGGVRSGEAFDWFYASAADRKAQRRTPITDGAYGKPWVFRQKDLAGWWLNGHVERAGGVELGVATAWQPGSKPIWLTETGFPAVDRGPNGPNVFPDPKSSESAYPAFSYGVRDDLAPSRGLEATLRCFDPAQAGHPVGANPVSPVTGLRMVDSARTHIWAWDARPFPAFPQAVDVWGDGANWSTGHWLNGRLEGVPLDVLVREIAADLGGVEVDASALEGFVDGYVLDRTLSARGALEPLAALWGFDAVASGSVLRFQRRDRLSALTLGPDDLVAEKERPLLTLTRAQETELPREISIAFGDGDNAYASAVASSRRVEGPAVRASRNEAGLVSRRGPMQRLADRALQDAWTGRETLETTLRPGLVALEIGDVVGVEVDGAPRTFRITRLSDGNARKLEARAVERPAEAQVAEIAAAPRYASPPVAGPPHALIVDLPATRSEPPVLQWLAAAANPWPGGLTLWRSADGASFEPLTRMDAPAVVGELLAPFPAGPLWCWDDAAVLSLRLSGGHLATVTDLAALDAAAPLAVQGPDGAWEIVSFARATLTGDRQWTLRRLLRGLGGSEAAAGRAAPAGSPVVLVDPSLVPLATGSDALNRPWLYRLAPAGLDVSAPQALAFAATPGPAALRPLSPVRAAARRDGGGVRLSWIRRTRLGGDNWEQAEVPLSEENEAYEVDVLGGGVVKRTLSTTAPQALYAAADELADFGAAQSTLSVRIAQLGASVGRGAVLEATLPVG